MQTTLDRVEDGTHVSRRKDNAYGERAQKASGKTDLSRRECAVG